MPIGEGAHQPGGDLGAAHRRHRDAERVLQHADVEAREVHQLDHTGIGQQPLQVRAAAAAAQRAPARPAPGAPRRRRPRAVPGTAGRDAASGPWSRYRPPPRRRDRVRREGRPVKMDGRVRHELRDAHRIRSACCIRSGRGPARPRTAGRSALMVPRRRLELPRPCGHRYLKPARLPIPPPGLRGNHGERGRGWWGRCRRVACRRQPPPRPGVAGGAASGHSSARTGADHHSLRIAIDGSAQRGDRVRRHRLPRALRRPPPGRRRPRGARRGARTATRQRAAHRWATSARWCRCTPPSPTRRRSRAPSRAPSIVINLVGILAEARPGDFHALQAEGPGRVARLAARGRRARAWCRSRRSAPPRTAPAPMDAARPRARRP